MNTIHTITVNGQSFQVTDPAAARINDGIISRDLVWSAKQIVDALCPAFSKRGERVVCRPVAGYPLTVETHGAATKIYCNATEFPVGAEIPAFAGENVLQADAGEITVTGRADPVTLWQEVANV